MATTNFQKRSNTSSQTHKTYQDDLVASDTEGLILGCTVISLLVTPQDTDVVLFDTTTIHATQAVEMALLS